MTFTYENVSPSLIANTTMQIRLIDGVPKQYLITVNEGYVLHDSEYDIYPEYDEEGNGIGEPVLGYTQMTRTCGYNYDFNANPRQFYAVLADSVPVDSIYSDDTDHEIMGDTTEEPEQEVM
jgi:hypothetical protein